MLEIVLFQIKKICKYKTVLFMDIFNILLNFIVQYYLWRIIFSKNSLYFKDFNQVIIYYFVISILSTLIRCNASDIADSFKHGKMDRILIRPIKLFKINIIENISSNLFLFICTLPLLLIFIFSKLNFQEISLLKISFSLILIAFGYLIYYCIDFLVGLLALLIDEIWAIRAVVTFCIHMISGYYLPLDMFHPKFVNFLQITPFYYIYYLPTIFITENPDWHFIKNKLYIMIFWVLILLLFSKKAFKKLIKNYSAYGG